MGASRAKIVGVALSTAIAGAIVGGCSLVASLDGISDGERPLPTPDAEPATRAPDADAGGALDATAAADAADAADAGDAAPARLRVFVTSTKSTAALGGIQSADERCTALAQAAKRSGTFVAWLSGDSSTALARLTTTGPWYRYDDVLAVSSRDELIGGAISAPINVDETGAGGITGGVWTGVSATGKLGGHCLNWGLVFCAGVCLGTAGKAESETAAWTSDESPSCLDNQLRLYCFQN